MEDKNVSGAAIPRREALKLVAAATGAAALSALPNGWQAPLVTVGAVPAKAQDGSGLYIDQASLELSGDFDDSGGGDAPGESPMYVTIEFDYVNAVGGVALMDVTFHWTSPGGQDGSSGGTSTGHVAVSNPDGTAGHINHTIHDIDHDGCVADLDIYIQDGGGRTSNTVTGTWTLPC